MKTTEKLQLIIEKCAHNNQSEFARRLGLAQSSIASWLKRGTGDLVKIAEAFPELSAEWLLRGEGDMFKSGHTHGNTQVNYGANAVQAMGSNISLPAKKKETISPLYDVGYLALDEKSNEVAMLSNTQRVMRPVIPDQLFRQPGQDIYNFLIDHKGNLEYEPNIAQFCEYTATATVSTDSLSPELRRGDKIAVKLMPTLEIINGEMYLITDKNRGAILRYCTDRGDHFHCVSLNSERYENMEIMKENITSVWQVVGALKIYL